MNYKKFALIWVLYYFSVYIVVVLGRSGMSIVASGEMLAMGVRLFVLLLVFLFSDWYFKTMTFVDNRKIFLTAVLWMVLVFIFDAVLIKPLFNISPVVVLSVRNLSFLFLIGVVVFASGMLLRRWKEGMQQS